jgi:hypothetical protein
MSATSGPPDWSPAPPDGYQCRDSPSTLPLAARLFVGLWVPFSLLAVLALIFAVHGVADGLELFATFVPQNPVAITLYAGWVLSLVILLVVIHESLHILAAAALGYDTALQAHVNTRLDWTVSVVTFGDFQTRLETAVIALAPLVLFTPFGIVALAFGGEGLAVAAGVLLAVNAAGAVLDVRTALLMLSLPRGTLVRHDSAGREQYYAPENSG